MTVKETIKEITKHSHLVVRYISHTGEYRITSRYGTASEREEMAYYTNDSEDAIETAKHMQGEIEYNNDRRY